jgi:hypothetical protein
MRLRRDDWRAEIVGRLAVFAGLALLAAGVGFSGLAGPWSRAAQFLAALFAIAVAVYGLLALLCGRWLSGK